MKHIDLHHHDTDQTEVYKSIAHVRNASVDIKAALACPPPAHLKSPAPTTVLMESSNFNTVTIKSEMSFSSLTDAPTRPDNSSLSQQFGAFFSNGDEMLHKITEKPLDFSKQQKYIPLAQKEGNEFVNKSLSLADSSSEFVPIDLSVPRSSHNSLLLRDHVQGTDNQV